MPTYAEELSGDPVRLRRALNGLIEEQQVVVRRLEEELASGRAHLDRAVLKLVLFSQQFGRGSAETVVAQREAEDANTPVAETTRKLERQQAVLDMYCRKLADLEAGTLPIDGAEAAVSPGQ